MNKTQDLALRSILAIAGMAIIFLGLNVGLGGIRTLGWQGGGADFVTVVDAETFAIRDNHIRFIGGVWLGVGLLMLTGSIYLDRMRPVLAALCLMILVGGLSRLSGGVSATLGNTALLPSVLLELVGFPLLGVWLLVGRTKL